MLVIGRKEGEEVVIGDPQNPIAVVRIKSIKGDRVRVEFDAPRELEIHRREVANRIAAEEPDESAVPAEIASPAAPQAKNADGPGASP